MRFEELMNRLTGVNCPIFGISWNPSTPECTIARQIMSQLEARRVLYSDYEFEIIDYCVRSVLDLKEFLMKMRNEMIVNNIKDSANVYTYTTAMLKACNHFLDRCKKDSLIQPALERRNQWNDYNDFQYNLSSLSLASALGELRSTVGFMAGQMAKAYGLSVDDDLAKIIPN